MRLLISKVPHSIYFLLSYNHSKLFNLCKTQRISYITALCRFIEIVAPLMIINYLHCNAPHVLATPYTNCMMTIFEDP